jgi:SPP1 family phage portal protein
VNEYINLLKNNPITADIVEMMIKDHEPDHKRMKSLYERYKASTEGVPILSRKPVEYEDFETDSIKRIDNKVNNRLNNAFDADIVDTKVGYMFGYPISYTIDDEQPKWQQTFDDFLLRNNVEDVDSEAGKMAAICGYASRLAYVDSEGKERIMNVDPWEAIILSTTDITEPQYALRYYKVFDWVNGQKIEKRKAEFYDDTKVYYFESVGEQKLQLTGEQPHLFDYCPLFGIPNNKELMGDAEKVLKLIDAYDRTLSDASNEIEQYRLAYLILKGLGVDEETLARIKQAGIFELLDEKDDVKYLTKDINDALIEHHLDRLEENILRFAKSVNFTDESFAGNITGVAMKFKIMALENKSITMERKMTAALRYQFKVICSAWAKKGLCNKEDYLKIWYSFKRNLPVNLLDEAQTTAALRGHVSEKTRLSLLSFVDDVEYELEEMRKEEEEYDEHLEPLGGEVDDGSIGD